MNTNLVSIHYGEIALKKGNRGWFEEKLLKNLLWSLDGLGVRRVDRNAGRIILEFAGSADWSDIKERIRNIFGFSYAYSVNRTALSMEDLEKKLVSESSGLNFNSFAVRTKRAEKRFFLTSPEINERLGRLIKDQTGARVDLEFPECTFHVEVLPDAILFSHERLKGPGGLPTGVSGHAALLISGGIDSPVAGWMMMKRGLALSYIHFHSAPFTDQRSVEKVDRIVEALQKWRGGSRLFLVPFGELQKKIVVTVPPRYRVLLYRRFMFRIASSLAGRIGASALVTGEALGQVASQTLANLAASSSPSDLPVLRPLVGMDKEEIISRAREIGTYSMSIEPHHDCCSFLEPPKPATKTSSQELDRVEEALSVESLVEGVLGGVETVEVLDRGMEERGKNDLPVFR